MSKFAFLIFENKQKKLFTKGLKRTRVSCTNVYDLKQGECYEYGIY